MEFPEILRKEMRLRDEPVPGRLADPRFVSSILEIADDCFLFETPSGTRFHYRKGKGIAVQPGPDSTAREDDLFYHGTVYGAVAWLNGLLPLHASSVAIHGRVIAFTGDAGEGKSTLAAALAGQGFRHLSDDVLLVDPSGEVPIAFPDRNRIKLCPDAFELTGARQLEPVDTVATKFFARLGTESIVGSEVAEEPRPAPLSDLIVLSTAIGNPHIEPLLGADKLTMLSEALYRVEIPTALQKVRTHREAMLALSSKVRCWRLTRARDRARFSADIAKITELVHKLSDRKP